MINRWNLIFNRQARPLLRAPLVALAILFVGLSAAQDFNFQEFSIHQGLPQSQANAILFDSKHLAWIGTQSGGLCVYDGNEARVITKNDSLISNKILSLAEIGGEIWVGQKGGVSVLSLEGDVRRNIRLADRSQEVTDIVLWKGRTYLATGGGVRSISRDGLTIAPELNLEGFICEKFFIDEKGELWVCTQRGLIQFKDQTKRLNRARGLKGDRVTCAVNFQNLRAIATYDGGLDMYDPSAGILEFPALEELDDEIVLSLFVTGNEELWIGTMNSGVFVFSLTDRLLKRYSVQNGLTNNHVRVIASDYWENIWLGTSGGGVSIFHNSPFVRYSTAEGLNSNYIFSVTTDRQGNLWVGTEGGGVVRINDTSSVVVDEEFGFLTAKVKALFEDADGDLWFGTDGSGLGIYSPSFRQDTVIVVHENKGLSANWIRCFAQHSGNRQLYVGTSDAGIFRVDKGNRFPESVKFARLKLSGDVLPARIASLEFIDERLWFTTEQSTFGFIEKGKCKTFTIGSHVFRNATGDSRGVWLGTSDDGILRVVVDGDSIASKSWINVGNHLHSNSIYQLKLSDNFLWAGTGNGLNKLVLDSLGDVVESDHYGFEEGFEGVEANLNSIHKDALGNIWFGSIEGLYLYQGGEVNYAQRKPPLLRMRDIQINYQSISNTEYASSYADGKLKETLELPYDKNNLQFSFSAIHYTYAKNIRYRWQLSSVDSDWTPPSKITAANYSNLAPGSYTFRVVASIDDNWEIEPIELNFRIDQPYWETPGFKALYVSSGVLAFGLTVLYVLLRIRRKNKQVREKLEMERNLIDLEQKALRLQMNPHFIFNVLNSIHNLIILNDPDKARYALSKFSKLMRRVLENSREKLISIDDEKETIENYVQLEKLTSATDVEVTFEIDSGLDTGEAILPPLMIQPFIENAIIHGLKQLNRPGRITVGFKLLNESRLEVSVSDNGRGRVDAEKIKAQKDSYHKSTALQVTQERLAHLNRDEAAAFEILDLRDQQGNASGTCIIFRMNIHHPI